VCSTTKAFRSGLSTAANSFKSSSQNKNLQSTATLHVLVSERQNPHTRKKKKKTYKFAALEKKVGSRVDQETSQLVQKLPSYMNIP
jgi:hypothetical protein